MVVSGTRYKKYWKYPKLLDTLVSQVGLFEPLVSQGPLDFERLILVLELLDIIHLNV